MRFQPRAFAVRGLSTKGCAPVSILQNRLTQAEFSRTVWTAQPEPGVTLDDIVRPDYWAHVAKTIKKGDRIEITSPDGSWFAELLVRATTGASVQVFVMRKLDFPDSQPTELLYDVKHRGAGGWSVIRKSDKTVMFEKGETREDAEKWIRTSKF